MTRREPDTLSAEMQAIMKEFCRIVLPGYNNRKGYINVKKLSQEAGITPRTYYHWVSQQSVPKLPDFIRMLNERGYSIKIEPRFDLMEVDLKAKI